MSKSIMGFIKRKMTEHKVINQEIKQHGNKGNKKEMDMLLLAHSLEKGLSMEVKKKDWGKEKAVKLLNLLGTYNKNDFIYTESMSVLEKYLDQNIKNSDVLELQKLFASIKERTPFNKIDAGAKEYVNVRFDTQTIADFIKTRHSIRHFEKVVIDEEVMRKVAELTNTAPSACNRQPSKIYYSNKPETVNEIEKYIPGNKGFEGKIPNWAFITTDRDMFTKPGYMQWYVNGGIFTAYFILALQTYGFGSCVFQVPIAYDGIDELKNIIRIPDNEAIVAAVGFGVPAEKCSILASSRKPVNEMLFKID